MKRLLCIAATYPALALWLYASPLPFALGLAAWSLAEYAAHRWLLHGPLRHAHARHHAAPEDLRAIATPLAVSAPLAALLALATPGFASGVLAGYVAFEALHLALHLTSWRVLRPLRRRHARHHYDPATGYGVTSPMWDVLLRTPTYAPHPFAAAEDHPEAL